MGNITGPDENDMYFWRAGGSAEAQATIALLWSQLGSVKRAQAAAAMRTVRQKYMSGAYAPRAPRMRRHRAVHAEHLSFDDATVAPRDSDLAWAAGFLDGEGHFGLPRAGARKNAPDWHRIRVSAAQHGEPGLPPEVLLRLQDLLGGKIEVHGEPDDFKWVLEGLERVEDTLLKVRPWLGAVKQEQACAVISRFRSQVRLHGDAERCARGHAYTRVYMGPKGPRNKCKLCERIRQRKGRAARGIKPRQFKNVARRYTF